MERPLKDLKEKGIFQRNRFFPPKEVEDMPSVHGGLELHGYRIPMPSPPSRRSMKPYGNSSECGLP